MKRKMTEQIARAKSMVLVMMIARGSDKAISSSVMCPKDEEQDFLGTTRLLYTRKDK